MSEVANKRHAKAIFFQQHHLPVPSVCVELLEDVCFSEQIDTLVHSQDRVIFLYLYRI